MARLLLGRGAARGLRDQAGLTPGDVARQRNHWDLLTLLGGAGPPETRHQDATGASARARSASGSVPPRRGVAPPRCRTLSAGAAARGGGAERQSRTPSADFAARGHVVCPQGHILSKGGAGGGAPRHGRRFPAGMRGPRPNPATTRGRSGVATGSGGVALAEEWPCDWLALGACGPTSDTRISPLCLTPSPERGSPQVAWDSPARRTIPLSAGGEGQKQKANGREEL